MALRTVIIVIDDDHDVRKSLTWLLQSAGYVVRDFASAEAFLSSNSSADVPVCLLLDVHLPGKSGLVLLEQIREKMPHWQVLMLTAYGDVRTAVTALKMGAVDFIEKPYDEATILETVRSACQAQQTQLVSEQRRAHVGSKFSRLTPREREVFKYLVQGVRSREIAEILGIRERTLECHRQRVIHKMEVNSIAELVRVSMLVNSEGA